MTPVTVSQDHRVYSLYSAQYSYLCQVSPLVYTCTVHRQVLVLAHQAQSVGSGQSWVTQVRHRSDVTTDQLVMSDVTLLQKQTISHRMLNRR